MSVSKQITVGIPYIGASSYNNNGTIASLYPIIPKQPIVYNPACDDRQISTLMNVTGASSTTWGLASSSTTNLWWSQSGQNLNFYTIAAVPQTATFNFSASNSCGTKYVNYAFQTQTCTGGTPLFIKSVRDSGSASALMIPNSSGTGQLQIAPNPSSNIVQLYSDNAAIITKVTVLDVTGIVKKQLFLAGNGGKIVTLNVADLSAGIYIVKAYTGQKWIAKLFIKQ